MDPNILIIISLKPKQNKNAPYKHHNKQAKTV